MGREWARRLLGGVGVLALLAAGAPSGMPADDRSRSRVIVLGSDTDALRAAVADHDGKTTSELEIVDGVVASVPSDKLEDLESDARVGSVSADRKLWTQSESFGGVAPATYSKSIRADDAHERGLDGSGVGIALLDTGISEHADLEGRIAASADLSNEGSFVDSFGHGTFLAGLIAGDGASSNGRFSGVAPGAHLMSVKVAGADGETTLGRVLYGLQLIDHSQERFGIRVVVMALAGPAAEGPDPLELAVDRLWADGLVVVLPSGNDGPATGTVSSPGVDPYAVTVGGTDEMGTPDPADDTVAEWSASGETYGGIQKPDVVAPGAHLVSLRSPGSTIDASYPSARIGGDYFRGSGTSMSAAVTGGAAALLLQEDPSLTPDEVKGRLIDTATAIAAGEDSLRLGSGSIDVARAAATDSPPANQELPSMPAEPAPAPNDPSGTGARSFDWQDDPSGTAFWAGRAWAGRAWAGRAWAGRAWAGSEWSGRAWADSDWAGRAWAGRAWAGRAWAGRAWAGRAWAGRAWAGRAWAGRAWAGRAWASEGWE